MWIMEMARRYVESDGIAQRMELGAQPGFAATDPLVRAIPPLWMARPLSEPLLSCDIGSFEEGEGHGHIGSRG